MLMVSLQNTLRLCAFFAPSTACAHLARAPFAGRGADISLLIYECPSKHFLMETSSETSLDLGKESTSSV